MSRSWQSRELLARWAEAGLPSHVVGELSSEFSAAAKLTVDSRQVGPGDLFVALVGDNHDGRDFAAAAVAAGAVAVLVDAAEPLVAPIAAPVIVVEGLAAGLSLAADRFYASPSAQLKVIGVTGTNGKTTVCQLLGQLLERLGSRVATIGTLGSGCVGEPLRATGMTTADACTTQWLLAEFVAAGCDTVVMEVSSHALDQGRVAAVRFEQALFTNLSRDHLDYHGTLQNYAAAKARLFAQPGLSVAILNSDDAASSFMATAVASSTRVSYFSAGGIDGNLRCLAAEFDGDGLTAQLGAYKNSSARDSGESVNIRSPLLGDYNLANLLAVISSAVAAGWPLATVAAEVASLAPVAGRLQRVNRGDLHGEPLVVVDYAHTPDALEKVLAALRPVTEGELWVVFGCGGDRDTGKRPLMARVAQAGADQLIITSDNPRSERPAVIIEQIQAGLTGAAVVEPDRCAAIHRAVAAAGPLDTVLIAGKGHERYQLIGAQKLPFDDVGVAQAALMARATEQATTVGKMDGEAC